MDDNSFNEVRTDFGFDACVAAAESNLVDVGLLGAALPGAQPAEKY
jgi:hypothetical protein